VCSSDLVEINSLDIPMQKETPPEGLLASDAAHCFLFRLLARNNPDIPE
jgi:organic hydroperoxide reductase OsmC/OhrA